MALASSAVMALMISKAASCVDVAHSGSAPRGADPRHDPGRIQAAAGRYRESMTERKPAGKSFTSWIDEQIQQAQDRGAFDNLPGAGKPLPKRSAADDGMAWLRDKLQREGVPAEELLPTPLKLRKQAEWLAGNVQDLASEQEVRDAVAELNRRVIEWRRIPLGPSIHVPLMNADQMVSRWREARRPALTRSSSADTGQGIETGSPAAAPDRPAWWRRLGWRSRSGRPARRPDSGRPARRPRGGPQAADCQPPA